MLELVAVAPDAVGAHAKDLNPGIKAALTVGGWVGTADVARLDAQVVAGVRRQARAVLGREGGGMQLGRGNDRI